MEIENLSLAFLIDPDQNRWLSNSSSGVCIKPAQQTVAVELDNANDA
jgi:hypothetical protein